MTETKGVGSVRCTTRNKPHSIHKRPFVTQSLFFYLSCRGTLPIGIAVAFRKQSKFRSEISKVSIDDIPYSESNTTNKSMFPMFPFSLNCTELFCSSYLLLTFSLLAQTHFEFNLFSFLAIFSVLNVFPFIATYHFVSTA